MKSNPISQLLSIHLPILQAPTGCTAPPALAAAKSNAGGLGMLGTGWDTPRGHEGENPRDARADHAVAEVMARLAVASA